MSTDNTLSHASPGGEQPDGGDTDADLRRDIADELADHLELSVRAKQLGGLNESAAQEQALEHFGNPKRIAQQLYFAAMKGRLMRQNIQTFAIVIMALGVLVLGAMSWAALRAGQAGMIDAMSVNNQAMLDALSAMGKAQNAPTSPTDTPDAMEWGTLTIELVGSDGKPIDATGYMLSLGGKLLNRDEDDFVQQTLESASRHTFGPIRIGRHRLEVYIPGKLAYHHDTITIWPGRGEHHVQVVCPTSDQFAPLPDVKVQLPEDLQHLSQDITLFLELEPSDHTAVYLNPDVSVAGYDISRHGSDYRTSTQSKGRWWLSTKRWVILEPSKRAQHLLDLGDSGRVVIGNFQVDNEHSQPREYNIWSPIKGSPDLPYLKTRHYRVRECMIAIPHTTDRATFQQLFTERGEGAIVKFDEETNTIEVQMPDTYWHEFREENMSESERIRRLRRIQDKAHESLGS